MLCCFAHYYKRTFSIDFLEHGIEIKTVFGSHKAEIKFCMLDIKCILHFT